MLFKRCSNKPVLLFILGEMIIRILLVFGFLDSVPAFLIEGLTKNKDVDMTCMLTHCGMQMTSCILDSNCQKALGCLMSCGLQNQTCAYQCLYSHENAIFDTFNQCIFQDYHCMKMKQPTSQTVCKRPPNVATTFDIQQFIGTWFIVLGSNRVFDCFDCQNTTFWKNSEGRISAANYLAHETQIDTVSMWNASTPAIFRYESFQMGRNTTSEWRILDFGTDYFFTYYCGSVSDNSHFEGSVVYSKTKILSENSYSKIQNAARKAGLDLSTYCEPSFDIC